MWKDIQSTSDMYSTARFQEVADEDCRHTTKHFDNVVGIQRQIENPRKTQSNGTIHGARHPSSHNQHAPSVPQLPQQQQHFTADPRYAQPSSTNVGPAIGAAAGGPPMRRWPETSSPRQTSNGGSQPKTPRSGRSTVAPSRQVQRPMMSVWHSRFPNDQVQPPVQRMQRRGQMKATKRSPRFRTKQQMTLPRTVQGEGQVNGPKQIHLPEMVMPSCQQGRVALPPVKDVLSQYF
ncbi:hypothetical protein FALBO_4632 [Fusarium albosuccineum]|uniref:Uncharacterized protein n=1 Tax=Fusarium albosuccineum TaxID=1237068 RepID=A0A8H4PG67_9HYPO|nr:hypothetical protein FALBO_4632 [Fusarium albosuccineum]